MCGYFRRQKLVETCKVSPSFSFWGFFPIPDGNCRKGQSNWGDESFSMNRNPFPQFRGAHDNTRLRSCLPNDSLNGDVSHEEELCIKSSYLSVAGRRKIKLWETEAKSEASQQPLKPPQNSHHAPFPRPRCPSLRHVTHWGIFQILSDVLLFHLHFHSGKQRLPIHRRCTQPRIQKYPVRCMSAQRMDFSRRYQNSLQGFIFKYVKRTWYQGPCKNTFCQCEMGHGWLQTCQVGSRWPGLNCFQFFLQQEGTFFDEEMCVCNWPWNIDACPQSENGGEEKQARKAFGLDGPRPRCTKMAATP